MYLKLVGLYSCYLVVLQYLEVVATLYAVRRAVAFIWSRTACNVAGTGTRALSWLAPRSLATTVHFSLKSFHVEWTEELVSTTFISPAISMSTSALPYLSRKPFSKLALLPA